MTKIDARVQELVKERLTGKLPVIEVMGHTFFVDIRMGVIRPKDDFSTLGVKFDDMEEDAKGMRYFLYNPNTHSIANIDLDRIKKIPTNVFPVKIPNEMDMDPIGFARNYGLDIDAFLLKHPPLDNLKAEVIDWNDTVFPGIVKGNNRKQDISAEQNQGDKKQAVKKNRGKGL